jgi:enhancing lycopene biosynthesis protein 2
MNIAIILSGCGNRDGSELQETLSLFLAIDRRGWHYQCFAP